MRLSFVPVMLALGCGPALASGGASCVSEEGPAKIEIQAGVTRGMGGPVFSFEAKLEVTDAKAPEDLRVSKFTKEQMTQYWFDSEDLRFDLYRERSGEGAFGSVELIVKTKPVGDDIGYTGTYIISIFDASKNSEDPPFAYEGKIVCTVE